MVKYLITHGANVALQDKNGCTALHFACSGTVSPSSLVVDASLHIVKYLVENNADVNVQVRVYCTVHS